MDDSLIVRRLERVGDLCRNRRCVADRERSGRDPLRERRTFHQLHGQRVHRRRAGRWRGILEPLERARCSGS
jgi:hypothetical protein